MAATASTPVLEVAGIEKWFGAVGALQGVSLGVAPGEVVGLLGDNGAGKTTLIKIISGVYRPTAGVIRWQGREVAIDSPEVAHTLGIETVFQDLALVPNLDVPSNFFIGRELTWTWLGGLVRVLKWRQMETEAAATLAQLDIHIPSLRASVDDLSGGQRQAVAIARALRWNAALVILDEPTAALSVAEQGKVLEITRALAEQGVAVIYITHNILDALKVTDRIVVLHRGRKAGELITEATTEHEIVSMIMGRRQS